MLSAHQILFPPHFSDGDQMLQRLRGAGQSSAVSYYIHSSHLKDAGGTPLIFPGMTGWRPQFSGLDFTSCGLISRAPKRPDFSDPARRRATWETSNLGATLDLERVSAAGFRFDGKKGLCFWCGLDFETWETGADPINEHMRRAPWCPYIRSTINRSLSSEENEIALTALLQTKPAIDALSCGVDREVVTRVMQRVIDKKLLSPSHCTLMNFVYQDYLANHPPKAATSPLLACKYCGKNQIEITLVPCGHLITCLRCSGHLIGYCPICGSKTDQLRLTLL